MGNLTKITVSLQFDDHDEPVVVELDSIYASSAQQTIDAIIYMECNGSPETLHQTHGALH